jgi:hypothetical protein
MIDQFDYYVRTPSIISVIASIIISFRIIYSGQLKKGFNAYHSLLSICDLIQCVPWFFVNPHDLTQCHVAYFFFQLGLMLKCSTALGLSIAANEAVHDPYFKLYWKLNLRHTNALIAWTVISCACFIICLGLETANHFCVDNYKINESSPTYLNPLLYVFYLPYRIQWLIICYHNYHTIHYTKTLHSHLLRPVYIRSLVYSIYLGGIILPWEINWLFFNILCGENNLLLIKLGLFTVSISGLLCGIEAYLYTPNLNIIEISLLEGIIVRRINTEKESECSLAPSSFAEKNSDIERDSIRLMSI